MHPEVAAAIAERFGREKDSDCVILFCLDEAARCGDAGQQPGPAASDMQDGLLGDPLPGHLFLLTAASERFEAQAERWNGERERPAKRRKTSAPAGRSKLEMRVTLGSAQEVTAARAAIAFVYTGRVQAGSVREVLEVRQQAAYLQMKGCADACLEVLKGMLARASNAGAGGGGGGASTSSGRGGDEADTQHPRLQLFACEQVWPSADEDPGFAAFLSSHAKPQLVSYFGDAVAVLNTPSLRRQMLALPVVGLEALLQSHDFGTDSESTVLLVLAAWMRVNHAKTDAATRQRLSRLVRLVQLGPAYLYEILPSLASGYQRGAALPAGWMPISPREAAFIANYARASPEERAQLKELPPKAWDLSSDTYKTEPRRQCLPAEGRTFTWQVSEQDLREAVEDLEPGDVNDVDTTFRDAGGVITAAGFDWNLCVKMIDGQKVAGLCLYCFMPSTHLVEGGELAGQEEFTAVVPIEAKVTVNRRRGGGVREKVAARWSGFQDSARVGFGSGFRNALRLRQSITAGGGGGSGTNTLAPWSKYLHEGKITGTLTLLPPPQGSA